MIVISGCAVEQNSLPEVEPIDIVLAPILGGGNNEPDIEGDQHRLSLNHSVFDFASLSEEDFPRGIWTVNQLTEKYGNPEKSTIFYRSNIMNEGDRILEKAWIYVKYSEIGILSSQDAASNLYVPPNMFSFYTSTNEDGEYKMSDEDKNLEFEIEQLIIDSEDIVFPYGIRIGQSAKEQVLVAYLQENPYQLSNEDPFYDLVSYDYAFLNEDGSLPEEVNYFFHNGRTVYQTGCINYFFDEDGLLKDVEIRWWFLDA
jgi:hypothetical protein